MGSEEEQDEGDIEENEEEDSEESDWSVDDREVKVIVKKL